MIPELRDIIFLDIETIGVVEKHEQLSERFKTQWARKASFFKREENQTDGDLFEERAGIYAEFGKIIVIAIGKFVENENGGIVFKTKSFSGHDEKRLLEDFKSVIEKTDASKTKLCAHNGKEFDFPYISRRMLVNGIALPSLLNLAGTKKWEVPHLDTMEMWKFGDYKHYTSLDLLLALFDIPTSKGRMDGSMVNEVYYKEKNLPKIAEYCIADVVAIAQLYLRMKGMPLINQGNIIHSV
ncbi:MAG: 3'-5' exonuclease [Bacteroidetes bacterium]|nr:3'-5' exonuclease [Bacteroidota bacterium]